MLTRLLIACFCIVVWVCFLLWLSFALVVVGLFADWCGGTAGWGLGLVRFGGGFHVGALLCCLIYCWVVGLGCILFSECLACWVVICALLFSFDLLTVFGFECFLLVVLLLLVMY